jgi:NitT/TauT family transport system substrate-binding protein
MMKIRIGHLSTFYHTSILMIACNTLGDSAEWKLFGTGPAIVDAFGRDELDLAYIGLPPAVIGMDRGINIKCIAGGHVEGTVICGPGRFSPSEDMAELLERFTGHTIGVPGKGSIHDVIITDAIDRLALSSKIKVRNFRWADMVLDSLCRGEIDAAVGTPALAVAVMRYANGRILYPPSLLWPYNPSYGIVARDDFIERERDAVMDFLARHEEATALLRDGPDKAAQIIADHVKVVDKAFVLDTLRVSPRYCAALTDEYMASTMEFVKVLKRLGYIKGTLSEEEIFDTSLIKSVHPGKDHYG